MNTGNSSDRKVIAVTGATGAQGGGLARALLSDPESAFLVRAITRNPESEAALALRRLGADVVRADLDDADSLVRAFDNAYGAFCVTSFWEHFSPARELRQAENMAEAARKTELSHVIWSTLEDTRKWISLDDERMPTLMDRYKVPHFDAKGEANKFFLDRRVPTTLLLTSFYWENFIFLGMGPQKGEDGVHAITLPMGEARLPGIASEDIGRCALGIFRDRENYVDTTVGIAGEHLTGAEMAAEMSRQLGYPVRYNAVSAELFRSFDIQGAEDIGNMYQFKHDFNEDYCAARDVDVARKLNPELQTFADWLQANAERIP